MKNTVEIMMCTFRDGLGYIHKCHAPKSPFLLCEYNLKYKQCPLGLKASFEDETPRKEEERKGEEPICLCGSCRMTEQECRHKRIGPSKPVAEKPIAEETTGEKK